MSISRLKIAAAALLIAASFVAGIGFAAQWLTRAGRSGAKAGPPAARSAA